MTDQQPHALEIIKQNNLASTGLLCRKLKINFNEAIKIIEQLEKDGCISGFNGSRPRDILKK